MSLFSRISRWMRNAGGGHADGTELEEALGWVMAAAGDGVRRLRGDEERLLPALRRALGHVREIVRQTAGPIEIRRKRWDADPALNAFFPSVELLSKSLDRSERLGRFFRDHPAGEVFGLLTMRRTEKTTMAAELDGNLIQRDVARTSVGFEDHDIRSLFPTEPETRRDMVRHGMHYLGAAARRRIADIEAWLSEIETRRYVLEQELRFAEPRHDLRGKEGESDPVTAARIVEGRSVLAELDAKLRELGGQVASPEDCMERLLEVLEAPERHLDLRPVCLHLDAMNLKAGPKTAGSARQIRLTEIVVEDGTRAVGVIVKVPREEVRGKISGGAHS